MEFFRNKHVIIALLVAPVLAVISYFSVDRLVAETPSPAQAGQSYQLIEKPPCRYNSGRCELENGSFLLKLDAVRSEHGAIEITLISEHRLQGVMQAQLDVSGHERSPVAMKQADETGKVWKTHLSVTDPVNERLHLAVVFGEALYYADASLAFTAPRDENPFETALLK